MRRGQRLGLDQRVADLVADQQVAERLRHRRLAGARRADEDQREHAAQLRPGRARNASSTHGSGGVPARPSAVGYSRHFRP